MGASAEHFRKWELQIRGVIKKAEDFGALGAVEAAKALLLCGMSMYGKARQNLLTEEQITECIEELKRKTALLRNEIKKLKQQPRNNPD